MQSPRPKEINYHRAVKASIVSINHRRGTASALDVNGHKHSLPWQIMKRLPQLLCGATVLIVRDTHGSPSDVRIPGK
jgi:hypothetical protein